MTQFFIDGDDQDGWVRGEGLTETLEYGGVNYTFHEHHGREGVIELTVWNDRYSSIAQTALEEDSEDVADWGTALEEADYSENDISWFEMDDGFSDCETAFDVYTEMKDTAD